MSSMTAADRLILAWLVSTNLLAVALFAFDKWRAGKPGAKRVSEWWLAMMGAAGGWPGGLLAMLLFRHKTRKLSFQLKYGAALVIWCGVVYAAWRFRSICP